MTVDTTGGSAVVPYDPDQFGEVGLEDVGVSDVVIPRLSINHIEGTFKDNLSKAEFPTLVTVLLGLVKQRVYFHPEVEDNDKPMCKSPDFTNGFPNIDPRTPEHKRFPWAESNFDPANYPPENGINGLVTLPCASCVFANWSDKNGKSVPPPCSEQHTYPLLYSPSLSEGREFEGDWTAALISFQKTGIKPSRQYLSSFAQSKQPMFTAQTQLTLTKFTRGQVRYAVPSLKRVGTTDREEWMGYAEQYRSIRDFVRQAPRSREEDTSEGVPVEPSDNVNTGPTAPASAPAPQAPTAPAAAPSPAPAPTAPAPAATVSAPAPASASPTPPQQNASAEVAPATSAEAPADDDGLPF